MTMSNDILTVEDIIKNAVETAQSLIKERKHRLTINLPQKSIYIKGDLVQLSQIFSNLLNNAAKYTETGGEINIKAESVNRNVLIHISDTGIGISSKMLPNIFEMFPQVESSLERSQDNLGSGLAFVKRLVELQGGEITAASEGIRKGSEFSVCLPVKSFTKNWQNDKHIGHSHTVQLRENIKILVVEDNEDVACSMRLVMEALDCTVSVSNDGPNALQIVRFFLPDLVLIDIGLPGMSGYDLCMEMKKIPELKRTIFIAQTGWGQKEHLQRSKEVGFDHHLVKPIHMEALELILLGMQNDRREKID